MFNPKSFIATAILASTAIVAIGNGANAQMISGFQVPGKQLNDLRRLNPNIGNRALERPTGEQLRNQLSYLDKMRRGADGTACSRGYEYSRLRNANAYYECVLIDGYAGSSNATCSSGFVIKEQTRNRYTCRYVS